MPRAGKEEGDDDDKGSPPATPLVGPSATPVVPSAQHDLLTVRWQRDDMGALLTKSSTTVQIATTYLVVSAAHVLFDICAHCPGTS
jgi:hypothetical protein